MSILTVDGAPLDRSNLGPVLARPITLEEYPGGVVGSALVAVGSLAVGGGLAVGALVSFSVSTLLGLLAGLFAALFLYLGVGFVGDALRGRRRDRRALRIVIGLDDGVVEEGGESRRISLDGPFAFGIELRREVLRIIEVRRAFRGEAADSPLRKAMEWAVWIHLDLPRQGNEPLFVVLDGERGPYSFYASTLREEGEDIDPLLERGVPVVRLLLREEADGLQPVAERSAASLYTRPLFSST